MFSPSPKIQISNASLLLTLQTFVYIILRPPEFAESFSLLLLLPLFPRKFYNYILESNFLRRILFQNL